MSLLAIDSRVLDVGATDPELGQRLAEDNRDRYLGLVMPHQLADIRHRADTLASRFHPLTSMSQVLGNSTDMLILRRPFIPYLWSIGRLRHVRYIAVEVPPVPSAEAVLALLAGRLTGRSSAKGRFSCGSQTFEVVEVRGPRPVRARHYLSPVLGVAGLIYRLENAGLDYLALRWFEGLPELKAGEDLDMLVSDQDLAKAQALLAEEPGTIPVDLYSESGLVGADYQDMAYYPPALARAMLDQAITHPSGCRIPSPRDHLHSLAYHAVYHKGPRSGLPSVVLGGGSQTPEHDYAAVLQDLASKLGVALPNTMEGLDEYLAGEGWRPPRDTLRRLTGSNPWIQKRFFSQEAAPPDPPEPAVFFVREKAWSALSTEEILAVLRHLGFEVLAVRKLDPAARGRCAAQTRGGNWSQGPFPTSGGGPDTAIVAVHYAPQPVKPSLRARYPHLTNADTLEAKLRVRDLVIARVEASREFNAMHSSDNEGEALDYLDLALPDEADELRADIDRRREAFRTEVPVVKVLSRGRRAKVEVVQGEHGLVVRKTFAPSYLRHLERELEGLRELGPHVDAVPPLLEVGATWFTCPYYQDELRVFRERGKLLPLPVVHDIVSVLRDITARGFDLIDAKPDNFLLDPQHGLKLVDFEFLYRYPGSPPDFAASYGFAGVPEGFSGDIPVTDFNYDRRWRRLTGLPPRLVLEGSPWSQHIHRALHQLQEAAIGRDAPARAAARHSRTAMRRTRRLAVHGYAAFARQRAHRADLRLGADGLGADRLGADRR
jgi:hypothetical protein